MEDQLTNALIALQKLDKKLRLLRNRGEAKQTDVDDCKDALNLIREICDRHGIAPVDIDGRTERNKRSDQ